MEKYSSYHQNLTANQATIEIHNINVYLDFLDT